MLGREVHQGHAGIVMRFPSGARLRALGLLVAMAALILSLDISASRVNAAEADAIKPLAGETIEFLARTKLQSKSPIYLRVFKEESELEVWKARKDGRFVLVKTYPICNWSGALGPKQAVGDRMAPEGFYNLGVESLKPDSKYHLALNIGYPNALDKCARTHGRFYHGARQLRQHRLLRHDRRPDRGDLRFRARSASTAARSACRSMSFRSA